MTRENANSKAQIFEKNVNRGLEALPLAKELLNNNKKKRLFCDSMILENKPVLIINE